MINCYEYNSYHYKDGSRYASTLLLANELGMTEEQVKNLVVKVKPRKMTVFIPSLRKSFTAYSVNDLENAKNPVID